MSYFATPLARREVETLIVVKLFYAASLLILDTFMLRFFWYSGRNPQKIKKRSFLAGTMVSFLVYCIAAVIHVAVAASQRVGHFGDALFSTTLTRGVSIVLSVIIVTLVAAMLISYARLCKTDEPSASERAAKSMRRIGVAMVIIGSALAMVNF